MKKKKMYLKLCVWPTEEVNIKSCPPCFFPSYCLAKEKTEETLTDQVEPWIFSRYDCACCSHCCTLQRCTAPSDPFSSPPPFSILSSWARCQQLPSTPTYNPLPQGRWKTVTPSVNQGHKATLAGEQERILRHKSQLWWHFCEGACIFRGHFVRL